MVINFPDVPFTCHPLAVEIVVVAKEGNVSVLPLFVSEKFKVPIVQEFKITRPPVDPAIV
jgi:hypothetical protein